MNEILHSIWGGLCGASLLEQSATLLGVLGVWLMIRQSLWAFPVGLLQVALSAVVFYQAKFYADMKLQAVFFAALAYGWWHWTHASKANNEKLTVSRMTAKGRLTAIVAGLLCTVGWGAYLAAHTDAAMPYRDAFISSFSIVAQWLQSRKKLENWAGWILVNATAVPVYWMAGMTWFSVLYFLFLLMAIGGHREWRKAESEGTNAN
jgi:nicotinamide mononucleotide transporter